MAQKIKKKIVKDPESKRNNLLSFIEADKKEVTVKDKSVSYKDTPSKRSNFRRWKKIDDFSKWKSDDFIGYYLHLFKEAVGEEDPDFKRANSYKFMKEKNCINNCLKTHFNGDREKFKEYIDFIIPWWMSPDSFPDSVPSIWGVFTSNKGTFVKKFVSEKLMPKAVKRKDADNKFASSDAWDSYFDEGGK